MPHMFLLQVLLCNTSTFFLLSRYTLLPAVSFDIYTFFFPLQQLSSILMPRSFQMFFFFNIYDHLFLFIYSTSFHTYDDLGTLLFTSSLHVLLLYVLLFITSTLLHIYILEIIPSLIYVFLSITFTSPHFIRIIPHAFFLHAPL